MNVTALFGTLRSRASDDPGLLAGLRAAPPDGGEAGQPATFRSATNLAQARLSSPMPWVIAIVIALTVVAAASGLALRNAAGRASADLAGGVTVQIVTAAPADRNHQADAALALLRRSVDVVEARRVAQDDLNALLEPWLGTRPGDAVDDLPIPALIDLRLSVPATPGRIAALHAAIAGVAPAARVDAQSAWLAPVFGAIATLQWLAGGLIALLALTTVAAVVLSARNALVDHRETIEIVHLLGGTDAQIARVFQRTAAMEAVTGGVIGLTCGALAISVLARQFSGLGSGLAAGATLGWIDWIVIALIPLLGIGLAVVTARVTVLAALRRML